MTEECLFVVQSDYQGWFLAAEVDVIEPVGDLWLVDWDGREHIIKRDHWTQTGEYPAEAVSEMYEKGMFCAVTEKQIEQGIASVEIVEEAIEA